MSDMPNMMPGGRPWVNPWMQRPNIGDWDERPSAPSGNRGGWAGDKAGWMATFLYWGWIITVIVFLLLVPVKTLLFWGDSWEISWIISTLRETMNSDTYGWTLTEMDAVVQIFASIIAVLIILIVVFTPFKNFRSPLNFAWMHALRWVNDLTATGKYKNDPEEMKNVWFRVMVYWLVTAGIFAMYYFLISNIVWVIADNQSWGDSVILMFWLMVMIWIVAFFNSQLIWYLEWKDPAPSYKWGVISNEKMIEGTASSRLLWWILLMVANIVFLSVSTILSGWAEEKITSSKVWTIIQWDATDISDLDLFWE